MSFNPETVTLREAGPYNWQLMEPLVWTGTVGDRPRRLEVPTPADRPFITDLASVPRPLTWLIPRYGKYTKAAVAHDYLCQNVSNPSATTDPQSLLPLRDRSDADEIFRNLMGELGVPKLRRLLMWAAVSWATLFTCLVPGRKSQAALVRWIARLIALVAIVAAPAFSIIRCDWAALLICVLALPAALLVAGTIGLGRADRVGAAVLMYGLTLLFLPLLVAGVVVAILLGAYLLLEDLFRRFSGSRRAVGNLFSDEAKLEKTATPQFTRLIAVRKS